MLLRVGCQQNFLASVLRKPVNWVFPSVSEERQNADTHKKVTAHFNVVGRKDMELPFLFVSRENVENIPIKFF